MFQTQYFLIEIWTNSSIQWEQIDGKFDREDGSLEHGNPFRLEGCCKKCHHKWKIRNAVQIDDIVKDL